MLTNEYLKTYFRTFRIGRLYFKFIKGTELESRGWTSEALSKVLEETGVIRLVTLQGHGESGHFGKGEIRYVEMPGKTIKKAELVELLKERKI